MIIVFQGLTKQTFCKEEGGGGGGGVKGYILSGKKSLKTVQCSYTGIQNGGGACWGFTFHPRTGHSKLFSGITQAFKTHVHVMLRKETIHEVKCQLR